MAATKSSPSASDYLFSLVWIGAALYGAAFFLQNAYNIRLQAIDEYGPVIHEFDPYFNWRATQYLYENGAKKFFKWFDHMVWYPLVSVTFAVARLRLHFKLNSLMNHHRIQF